MIKIFLVSLSILFFLKDVPAQHRINSSLPIKSTNPSAPVKVTTIRDTISIQVKSGWNLLSVPLAADDPGFSSLFPTAVSKGYFFDEAYQPMDSVVLGRAFWVKFASAEIIAVTGLRVFEQDISLKPGWNMIGGLRTPMSRGEFIIVPDSSFSSGFYGYDQDSGYVRTDTLFAGHGYWLKVKSSGTLSISEWKLLGLKGERISTITIHPANPDIIYAGSLSDFSAGLPGRMFKSINGGLSWDTLLVGGSYKQIEIDPVHPETLYSPSRGSLEEH